MKTVQNTRRVLARIRQKGLTLIEAAMVLGVAALVIAGVLVLYNQANTSSRTSDALNQLNLIQQAVRGIYGGQSNFKALDNEALISAKAIPQKMVTGTATLANSFNGQVIVKEDTASSGFTVSFAGIPTDACVQLVTKDYGRALTGISVGNTPVVMASGIPTPGEANAACTGGGAILWTFSN